MRPLLVRVELIDDLIVREQHAPAAVADQTEVVEDLLGILASTPPLFELLKCCGDRLSTGKASYGYHDRRPLIISFILTIRLLEFLAGPAPVRLFCLLLPRVVDEQRPVVRQVSILHLGVVVPLDYSPRECRADSTRPGHP